MKVLIFGRDINEVEKLVKATGFEITKNNPDFVISYGGDGTLMQAEYQFPGVPKILLRGSRICKRCSPLSNEEILEKVIKGRYERQELIKLEARALNTAMLAMNDVIIHNKDARHAIRYRLWAEAMPIGGEIIGDGVVIATPFGSTAYYRSITDSFFEAGIGLAFNNSTEQADHIVLKEEREIKIKIIRGPAVVFADNQERYIELEAGKEIVIKKARTGAVLVAVHHPSAHERILS